jgi:4-amino-4-deoxy-L-arabinose transferase-like glycosyltransferase
MKRLLAFFRSLDREAALDSTKNVLAILGVGTVIGDFASKMPLYFMLPALIILLGVWYMDYLRHDFQSAQSALKPAEASPNNLSR